MSPASEKHGKNSPPVSLEEESELRVQKSRQLAILAATAGLEKKCVDVEIIDVVGKVDYADFLVLMTGTSDRHVSAIARGVDEHLSKAGSPPLAIEGLSSSEWVLLDFFDIVVHVLAEGARDLYDLSGLWIDASRVRVPDRSASNGSDPSVS